MRVLFVMDKIKLADDSPLLDRSFVFGTATSSFQIEGAADQRLPCIWDTFCDTKGKIADGSDGLVACEHVDRWKEDVELIASLNVDAYRFSISWPRVIGLDGELNQSGVDFYLELLNALNLKGIKPFVTLYHWDLPQHIEDAGGWLNRQTAYLFADYVEKVVKAFGDRVHSYATFNEPYCSAFLGYEVGVHAPGKTSIQFGRQAAHHILLAHGLGMQKLREHSPDTLNGIVLNFTPCYPASQNEADLRATERANQYHNHWYIKPLFDGKYPDVIDDLKESDKPIIEKGDFDIMMTPIDFLGVNYYTRLTYSAPIKQNDLFNELPHLEPKTDIGWEIYPNALKEWLITLNKTYDLPPIYITENGAAMKDELVDDEVQDIARVKYYESHLNALHDAMHAGVNVKGYFAWSLMDNFEWAEGYLKRFGLVYVDYTSQKRTLKLSAKAYSQLISNR